MKIEKAVSIAETLPIDIVQTAWMVENIYDRFITESKKRLRMLLTEQSWPAVVLENERKLLASRTSLDSLLKNITVSDILRKIGRYQGQIITVPDACTILKLDPSAYAGDVFLFEEHQKHKMLSTAAYEVAQHAVRKLYNLMESGHIRGMLLVDEFFEVVNMLHEKHYNQKQ